MFPRESFLRHTEREHTPLEARQGMEQGLWRLITDAETIPFIIQTLRDERQEETATTLAMFRVQEGCTQKESEPFARQVMGRENWSRNLLPNTGPMLHFTLVHQPTFKDLRSTTGAPRRRASRESSEQDQRLSIGGICKKGMIKCER